MMTNVLKNQRWPGYDPIFLADVKQTQTSRSDASDDQMSIKSNTTSLTPISTPWTDARLLSAEQMREIADNITRIRSQISYYLSERPKLKKYDSELSTLEKQLNKAIEKRSTGEIVMGAIAVEKVGKSKVLSALAGVPILCSELERCTWSASSIQKSFDGTYSATVEYYQTKEFEDRISSTFKEFGLDASSWRHLSPEKVEKIRQHYMENHVHHLSGEKLDPENPNQVSRSTYLAWQEFKSIAASVGTIKRLLDHDPENISSN